MHALGVIHLSLESCDRLEHAIFEPQANQRNLADSLQLTMRGKKSCRCKTCKLQLESTPKVRTTSFGVTATLQLQSCRFWVRQTWIGILFCMCTYDCPSTLIWTIQWPSSDLHPKYGLLKQTREEGRRQTSAHPIHNRKLKVDPNKLAMTRCTASKQLSGLLRAIEEFLTCCGCSVCSSWTSAAASSPKSLRLWAPWGSWHFTTRAKQT